MNIKQWNAGIAKLRAEDLAARASTKERRRAALRRPQHMKPRRPFRRAIEMHERIIKLHQLYKGDQAELYTILEAMAPYESHGHGGKHRTKNRIHGGTHDQDRSIYTPHQGEQERMRRIAQTSAEQHVRWFA